MCVCVCVCVRVRVRVCPLSHCKWDKPLEDVGVLVDPLTGNLAGGVVGGVTLYWSPPGVWKRFKVNNKINRYTVQMLCMW